MSIILDGQSIYIRFLGEPIMVNFQQETRQLISGIEYRRISNNQHL